MFSGTWITGSTESFSDSIVRLREKLDSAEAVIIGAGAGLSTSAGFSYSGERFERYFADFIEKYGFRDMYSGGFCSFETPEEHWAYWSRYIYINRYMDAPKPVYERLLELVRDKDYFAITTNVDHCFQKAGFDKNRLFYTQGDYGLFQCSEPCCQITFDNEEIIREMVKRQKNMKTPSDLLPTCPNCGKPLTTNLRADNKFVQDRGWYNAAHRYEKFQKEHQNNKTLLLELGVGFNTPTIIKLPFWHQTAQSPNTTYATINQGEALCPKELQKQAICINADIGDVLDAV